MNLQTVSSHAAPRYMGGPLHPGSLVDDVVLRHLQTEEDIRSILHLRDEIDLSAHAATSGFEQLEKKGTSWGWYSDLSFTTSS